MTETKTKIYFAIKTEDQNIDKGIIKQYISINPTEFELMYSRGKIPKCTIWEYSIPEFAHWDIHKELNILISKLEPCVEGFKRLKNERDVNYVLQIVIYLGEETPALHFGSKVINFVSQIDAEIDCDMYNEK